MTSKAATALKQFCFPQDNSLTLGVNRFVVCTLLLCFYYFYRGHHASFWADVPDVYWRPIHVFRWFSIPRLSGRSLALLDGIWFVALVCTAVGLWTQYSSVVSFVCGSYLISLPQNFGKIDTSDGPVVLMLLILASCRCGDGFSIDAWKRGIGWSEGRKGRAYGWPNRAGQVLFAAVFTAAGISKLKNGGLAWISHENLSSIIIRMSYTGLPTGQTGLWLADIPIACSAMALVTIVCETFAWLALFSKKISMVIVPGLFAMLVGFKLCLGLWPIYLFVMFTFWIPWDLLLHRTRQFAAR